MIRFLLVKLPLIIWGIITVLCMFIDFVGGIATGFLVGIFVVPIVLIANALIKYYEKPIEIRKRGNTYYVGRDLTQKKIDKMNRK